MPARRSGVALHAADPVVEIYRTRLCPYCALAVHLLRREQLAFREIDVSADPERRRWLRRVTGRGTVPQVFVRGRPLGGYRELSALARSGALRRLAVAGPEETVG